MHGIVHAAIMSVIRLVVPVHATSPPDVPRRVKQILHALLGIQAAAAAARDAIRTHRAAHRCR